MDLFKCPMVSIKLALNNYFNGKEPWQIVTLTTSTVLFSVWFYGFLFQDESIIERTKKTVFRIVRQIPSIKAKIQSEFDKVSQDFERSVEERTKHLKYITHLPDNAFSKEDILSILEKNLSLGDFNWKDGLVSGTVYYYNLELVNFLSQVYNKTSYSNPLHPDTFPGLCKMEAEVIKMASNLFHGDGNVCGTLTTGGTESILMACKAYRDYGREKKGIKKPEMVVPSTVHAAFDKASQYFHIKVRSVPLDPYTCQVDMAKFKKCINSRTVMLVGSAPNFPYGTMDDIAAISELGIKYNIPVHVDSCLGGFLTCFMEDAGYPVPLCDFRLPGVTSISADTHKYGFCPKGSSVILYRNKSYLHHQYTVSTEWPGGVYGSPTVGGSRAGANIAVCWATLLNFGKERYVKATRDIIHTTKYIERGLRRIKGIFIFGQPVTSVVAIGSHDFDIYRLSTALTEKGWNLNILQFPSGIHICVTHMHTQPKVADKFIEDVKNSVAEIMKDPSGSTEEKMAIYGVAQKLPDRSIVGDFTRLFLDSMYYIPKETK